MQNIQNKLYDICYEQAKIGRFIANIEELFSLENTNKNFDNHFEILKLFPNIQTTSIYVGWSHPINSFQFELFQIAQQAVLTNTTIKSVYDKITHDVTYLASKGFTSYTTTINDGNTDFLYQYIPNQIIENCKSSHNKIILTLSWNKISGKNAKHNDPFQHIPYNLLSEVVNFAYEDGRKFFYYNSKNINLNLQEKNIPLDFNFHNKHLYNSIFHFDKIILQESIGNIHDGNTNLGLLFGSIFKYLFNTDQSYHLFEIQSDFAFIIFSALHKIDFKSLKHKLNYNFNIIKYNNISYIQAYPKDD